MRAPRFFAPAIVACLLLSTGAPPGQTYTRPSPVKSAEYFSRLLTEAWTDRPAEELIAGWGNPTKQKKVDGGGATLLYRIKMLEGFQITPGHHIAISVHGPYPIAGVYISVPGVPEPRVVGRLKARFHTDAAGVIREVEVLSLKWTGSRRHHEYPAEEDPARPDDPLDTGVKIEPD
jgi:hypothetical protein